MHQPTVRYTVAAVHAAAMVNRLDGAGKLKLRGFQAKIRAERAT